MKIIIADSYEEMSALAANKILEKMEIAKDPLICLASGDTPTGLYKRLIRIQRKGNEAIRNWNFVGLDEWVGMNREDPGSCGYYLEHEVLNPLEIPEEKICLFDGRAGDLSMECKRVNSFIDVHGGIDVAILGLGSNGHLGLNEPGSDEDQWVHVTELAESTRKVGQKYFSTSTELSKGITLGLASIMKAKTVLLLVNGGHKAEILKQVVEGEPGNRVPGSLLQKHKNCYLFTEKTGASLLKPQIAQ